MKDIKDEGKKNRKPCIRLTPQGRPGRCVCVMRYGCLCVSASVPVLCLCVGGWPGVGGWREVMCVSSRAGVYFFFWIGWGGGVVDG